MIRPLIAIVICLALAACATRQPAAPPVARVALPAAPPQGEPGDVTGLKPEQLKLAFGAPAFVRTDGTVQMWRYDSSTCKVFFFFYPYGDSLLVRHVETVPRGRNIAADLACLDTLRGHTPVS
jgi:hypothetical protein